MNLKITVILFLLLNTAAGQSKLLLRYISVENAIILNDGQLSEGGKVFPVSISGNPSKPIINSDAFAGGKSLLFQTPTGTSTQRYEYKLCDYDQPDALRFNNERYVGFALKIPEIFDPLEGSVIFFQAWQGSPWGPPIMLKITSGSNPYKLRLTIRNSLTGPNSENPDQELWSDNLYANNWCTFVIGMKPRVDGDSSSIQLWINFQKVLDWKNSGNIGYDSDDFISDKPLPSLCLKFGIYEPGSNSKHSLLFDEIRLADNYNDAIPGRTVELDNEFSDIAPLNFTLFQNYPNPFNPKSKIIYQIAKTGFVELSVYDYLGRKILTLVNEIKSAGLYEVDFDGANLPSGVYFYSLSNGANRDIKKMMMVK